MIQVFAFYLFATLVIASGVMTIASRNPVHSVLWLILAFFNAAGLFLLIGAEFLAFLLVIVVTSYWQTVFAYPSGGGSYIVTKDNLGTLPGLVAAAALLIDYVLTVAVSIASGVQNLVGIYFVHEPVQDFV